MDTHYSTYNTGLGEILYHTAKVFFAKDYSLPVTTLLPLSKDGRQPLPVSPVGDKVARGVNAVAHDERLGRTLQVPVADALVRAARQSEGVCVRGRQVQSTHRVTRVL